LKSFNHQVPAMLAFQTENQLSTLVKYPTLVYGLPLAYSHYCW